MNINVLHVIHLDKNLLRHVRVRDFIERKRVDVHNEHSDQSVQQDQLL